MITTTTGAAAAVAASAIIAVMGVLPSTSVPIAAADAQHPATNLAPATGEQDQSPNPQDCTGGLYDTVCTRTGDAELHSTPNPADTPQVPQAQTMTPWVVLGNPGIGHH